MKRILAALVLLASVAVVPSAFAGRCSDTGDCGTGSGGGGGYTQRESGVWVPNYTQRTPPVVTPAARSFGQDLGRDLAKDAVKGAVVYTVVTAWGRVTSAVESAWSSMTDEERAALPMMPIK